jgi:hypothetical protein
LEFGDTSGVVIESLQMNHQEFVVIAIIETSDIAINDYQLLSRKISVLS